jgi:hypothetical protein
MTTTNRSEFGDADMARPRERARLGAPSTPAARFD